MANKKVIFVQGTAYSGSTFFHMMLANDPAGFACGEVHALFRPHKDNHVNRKCTCGYEKCRVWPKIDHGNERYLYRTLFDLMPEVNFVVDSSKQPFWIHAQNRYVAQQGMEPKNILIWKTPFEFASSKTRKGEDNWARVWLNDHRQYITLSAGLRTIQYRQLVEDPTALQDVCRWLGIPFFPEKSNYWEKQHCVLGGNTGAKVHMYDKATASQVLSKAGRTHLNISHRAIEYKVTEDSDLRTQVDSVIDSDNRFHEMQELLQYADVSNSEFDADLFQSKTDGLRITWGERLLRECKYQARSVRGRYRYRNTPRFAATS